MIRYIRQFIAWATRLWRQPRRETVDYGEAFGPHERDGMKWGYSDALTNMTVPPHLTARQIVLHGFNDLTSAERNFALRKIEQGKMGKFSFIEWYSRRDEWRRGGLQNSFADIAEPYILQSLRQVPTDHIWPVGRALHLWRTIRRNDT